MNYYWAMLAIAPTSDLKVVKRAYAAQLKVHRPEDNAEYFQRLREAYEWVCQIGVHYVDVDFADDDEEFEAEKQVEREHQDQCADVSESLVTESAGSESAEAEHILAQAYPALDVILPSIPTHFPVTFAPPPSPSFPPLNPNLSDIADAPASQPLPSHPILNGNLAMSAASATPHVAYALSTELDRRPLRPLAQFIAAFWTASQQLKSITEIQFWLQAQAEYESLQLRPNLEAALGNAFMEHPWPWPAVLAVAELLDWGTVGNLVNNELNHALQLAQFQQRAAITSKPRWHQLFSKSSAAYFLLTPFSWPKTLFSALLPRTQQIDALCDEVASTGVDPSLVFNSQQIEFQRKLRSVNFNLPRLLYALTRMLGWPLLFSLLFVGVDRIAPLVGLAFGLAYFVIWIGFVANRLLFRAFWTPSKSGANRQLFWRAFAVTFAVACISALFDSSILALVLAGFLLMAVAQDFATALASAAVGSIVMLVIAAVLWPTQAPEKLLLTLPIAISLVALSVYAYQRRMPAEKLLASLNKPTTPAKSAVAPVADNFTWWWIIAGIVMMRIFAAWH